MRTRHLVLGLSVVLALAVAVPAFGGSDPTATTSASAKKIAKKAKKKATRALNTANQALDAANAAQATADQALNLIETSGGVPGPPGPAGPAGPAGATGPAGPGQGFNRIIDSGGTSEVTVGGFTLTGRNSGGNCNTATLTASSAGGYFESDLFNFNANNFDPIAAGAGNSEILERIANNEQGLVTARLNNGSGVAQFEYSLDSPAGNTCRFAGSAIGAGG